LSEGAILAVDTCFGACSAAVVEDGRVLAGHYVKMERGHAEALAPMVDAVMKTAGLAFAELDRLAVTTGPGTFTGQRVGLSFMRALRVALQKPLIGISSLAAMAEQARRESGASVAAAVHDAKRGEVYIEVSGGPAAQIMTIAEAAELLRDYSDLALAGTGAAHFARPGLKIVDITAPDAVWVARLAAASEPTGVPRPLYLRPPDAKLPASR
jgi:tRNA threonylcarbamoyladenosine biosynthesis protein TsaB